MFVEPMLHPSHPLRQVGRVGYDDLVLIALEILNLALVLAVGVTLLRTNERLTTMAVSEATFDQDLDTLVTGITSYITAAQAALAAAQAAGVDLSAEDAHVQTATTQLSAALAALSPTAAPSVTSATAALKKT